MNERKDKLLDINEAAEMLRVCPQTVKRFVREGQLQSVGEKSDVFLKSECRRFVEAFGTDRKQRDIKIGIHELRKQGITDELIPILDIQKYLPYMTAHNCYRYTASGIFKTVRYKKMRFTTPEWIKEFDNYHSQRVHKVRSQAARKPHPADVNDGIERCNQTAIRLRMYKCLTQQQLAYHVQCSKQTVANIENARITAVDPSTQKAYERYFGVDRRIIFTNDIFRSIIRRDNLTTCNYALFHARMRMGITQTEMAKRLGYTQENYSKYESGETIPDKRIRQFSEMFGEPEQTIRQFMISREKKKVVNSQPDKNRCNCKKCKSCFFATKPSKNCVTTCDYILITGHMRGCPPGEDCIKFKPRGNTRKKRRAG